MLAATGAWAQGAAYGDWQLHAARPQAAGPGRGRQPPLRAG
ncbi:MAG: hypothetical protein WKG07_03125 [Hymenobacter sp.]